VLTDDNLRKDSVVHDEISIARPAARGGLSAWSPLASSLSDFTRAGSVSQGPPHNVSGKLAVSGRSAPGRSRLAPTDRIAALAHLAAE
jgi:hypothetical protein